MQKSSLFSLGEIEQCSCLLNSLLTSAKNLTCSHAAAQHAKRLQQGISLKVCLQKTARAALVYGLVVGAAGSSGQFF